MTPTAHYPDLSHWEAEVDFHAVAAAGAPLVITKASEGASYVDPTYASFASRIRSVPLILGAYTFLDVSPERPQIDRFLNTAHLQKGDLQPIVDAEALGLSKAETFAALADLEARGFRPLLYANLSFFRDTLGAPTRWWLWLADYTENLPLLPTGVKLFAWQRAEHGNFPGVSHPCDVNYLYVPITDLKTKFCI